MQLKNSKGAVSSAVGKELASEVLNGKQEILYEAMELVNYEFENPKTKSIRASAAKIIEQVAAKKPELIAPHLEKLIPALSVAEPQTRWMLIQVFGFCAKLNPKVAIKGIKFAQQYISENAGVCLSGAANIYLGYIGELSTEKAKLVFPILENALKKATENEVDWALESFYKIYHNLDDDTKLLVSKYAKVYLGSRKKSTIKRVEKILKLERENIFTD